MKPYQSPSPLNTLLYAAGIIALLFILAPNTGCGVGTDDDTAASVTHGADAGEPDAGTYTGQPSYNDVTSNQQVQVSPDDGCDTADCGGPDASHQQYVSDPLGEDYGSIHVHINFTHTSQEFMP